MDDTRAAEDQRRKQPRKRVPKNLEVNAERDRGRDVVVTMLTGLGNEGVEHFV
jgi:hypothetical protein